MIFHVEIKKSCKYLVVQYFNCIFAPAIRVTRAFSSAGLEHLPYKQRVGGSNPSTPTQGCFPVVFRGCGDFFFRGRLAQLVQSICLTSRGSAVRIRQRPPIKKSYDHNGCETLSYRCERLYVRYDGINLYLPKILSRTAHHLEFNS